MTIDGESEKPNAFNSDLTVFFFGSLRSLAVTASLFPSSRFLASALLRPIDFGAATTIVELGIGTGAVTRRILHRMSRRCNLYALDINPTFVSHVRARIQDPRLVTIAGGAEQLTSILAQRGIRRVDAIVSSLGLTSMHRDQRSSIMKQAASLLSESGVLTQFQYLHAGAVPQHWFTAGHHPRFSERRFLRGYFGQVCSETVLRNVPPASVYTCRI